MCGRYSFVASREKLQRNFAAVRVQGVMQACYNIAPTDAAYVITNTHPTELQRFGWGLVPSWATDPRSGTNLINARAEGISSKPSFRMPVRTKRCIVPADSFYEWQAGIAHGSKQPYRIVMRDASLLAFAAIWDEWIRPDGRAAHTFAIITTEANPDVAPLHDRMPVILHHDTDRAAWLATDTPLANVLALLRPLPSGLLRSYPVSPTLNRPDIDHAELHTEITLPPALF